MRTPNGIIGKILEDDGTDALPIHVRFLDDRGLEHCDPEELTEVEPEAKYPTPRKFRKGDIVRRIDTGRGNSYENRLKIGKIYIVAENEMTSGNVKVHYDGDDGNKLQTVKWFDLELVEPVKEQPYYVKTGVVYRRNDGMPVATASFTNLGKEKAELLTQMVCDKLNEMEA